MADDKKITDLDEATTAAESDLLVVVDVGAAANKKMTVASLRSVLAGWRSITGTIVAVASDITIDGDSAVLVVDTSSVRSLTLPNPATVTGKLPMLVVDALNNSGGKEINLVRFGAEMIDGVAATKALNKNGGRWWVWTNGTDWYTAECAPATATSLQAAYDADPDIVQDADPIAITRPNGVVGVAEMLSLDDASDTNNGVVRVYKTPPSTQGGVVLDIQLGANGTNAAGRFTANHASATGLIARHNGGGEALRVSDGAQTVLTGRVSLSSGTPSTEHVLVLENTGGTPTGLATGVTLYGQIVGTDAELHALPSGGTPVRITGLDRITGIKHNFNAGTLPLATDDSSAGYGVGSFWAVPTAGVLVCIDASVGAAVWAIITGGEAPSPGASVLSVSRANSGGSDDAYARADHVHDGGKLAVSVKNADFTLLGTDEVVFIETGSGPVICGPDPALGVASEARSWILKKTTSDTNTITIQPPSGHNVEQGATDAAYVLPNSGATDKPSWLLVYQGGPSWWVIPLPKAEVDALDVGGYPVLTTLTGAPLSHSHMDATPGASGFMPAATPVDESTTTRTLTDSDHSKTIRCTHASGCTITVPTLTAGMTVAIVRESGAITLTASGTTLRYDSATFLPQPAAQWSLIVLTYLTSTSVLVSGDLAAA